MKGNRSVRMMAFMVLLSLTLAHLTGQSNLLAPTWLWMGAFVGFMALQATFTGFCPANSVLGGAEKSKAVVHKPYLTEFN